MSRGRARHQASRRRMYSARQRDLRERRLDALRRGEQALVEDVVSLEIEDVPEADVAVPIAVRLRRDANAA